MSVFHFVRNCQTAQSGCAILHSHQQWNRVPVAPHPCQRLALSVFWVLAILIGIWCCLILTCISLTTYDMEYMKYEFFPLFPFC